METNSYRVKLLLSRVKEKKSGEIGKIVFSPTKYKILACRGGWNSKYNIPLDIKKYKYKYRPKYKAGLFNIGGGLF